MATTFPQSYFQLVFLMKYVKNEFENDSVCTMIQTFRLEVVTASKMPKMAQNDHLLHLGSSIATFIHQLWHEMK